MKKLQKQPEVLSEQIKNTIYVEYIVINMYEKVSASSSSLFLKIFNIFFLKFTLFGPGQPIKLSDLDKI